MPEETQSRTTQNIPSTAQRRRYHIELRGQVGQGWMTAFAPLSFSSSNKVTAMDVMADQAGLRGILNRLWDLNLDILSVVEIAGPAIRDGGD